MIGDVWQFVHLDSFSLGLTVMGILMVGPLLTLLATLYFAGLQGAGYKLRDL